MWIALVNKFDARVSQGSLSFRVVTDHADVPAFVDLACEAHEESRFSYIPFSAEEVRKIAKNSGHSALFVRVDDLQLVSADYSNLCLSEISKNLKGR